MQHQYQGNILRPNLLIETQFSSEQEMESYKHFQFEVKDVISEASSYDILQQNSIDKALIINKESMEYYDALITGLGQLNNIIDSWQINTMSQTFDILKSLKPKRLLLMNHGRTTSKQLQSSKSVSNYKNQSGILKGLHKRKNTSTSQRDLERAEVLNEIITKLHSRQRQDSRKSASKSQFMGNKSIQKKQLVKYKIKKLDNLLKSYKQANEQSNKKSTVYYTKHYNKRKPNKNDYEQYKDMELSRNNQSIKMSTFQKMKKDIIRVENQVKQLKKINQIYRRQNYILKSSKPQEDMRRTSRGISQINQKEQIDHRKPYQLFEPRQTQYEYNHYPQQPTNYSPHLHYSNNKQNFSNQSSCHHYNYQAQYPSDFRQTNNHKRSINKTLNKELNKCHDFRHQIYWKTLVPQNMEHCVSDSNHIHYQPIVFCIKCGCKCAQKNQRSNVTQKKSYIPNSKQNQKTFQ